MPALLYAAPAWAQCAGDCDQDRRVSVAELVRGVNIALGTVPIDRCASFDGDRSDEVTIDELVVGVNNSVQGCPAVPTNTASPSHTTAPTHTPAPTSTASTPTRTPSRPAITALTDTSPQQGEGDVAITRETILSFNGPLDQRTVTDDSVHAEFGGERLTGNLHVSPDRTRVTLFYDPPLPGPARVRVTVDGDALRDEAGRPVDADEDGVAGGVASIDFDTVNLAPFPGTSICGRVFASNPAPAATGEFVNVPLKDVRISVDGMEDEIFTVTDERGDFRLENVPAGRFFVHIDGLLSTSDVPPGAYYPRVGKMWESVPGEEINIGEIYLPLIPPDTLVFVSKTEDTTVTVPPAVLEQFPQLEGIRIVVPADSLYREDGGRGGQIGIAAVDPDRLPAALPPGVDPDVVITVQAFGGTDFDTPVAVCFPNSEGLPPGDKSALVSFNHDTGRWEVRGSMTVSADGREVCTDPGVGITAPGWHGRCRRCNRARMGPINPGKKSQDCPNRGKPPACPNKDCPGEKKSDQGIGDPVYGFSGEFFEEVEDLRIEGRGIDFVWTRNYRSKNGVNTAQGNGWDFSYNIFLERDAADLMVCDGTGRTDRFQVEVFFGDGEGEASVGGGSGAVSRGAWARPEFFREMTCRCAEADCVSLCGGSTATVQPPATGELPGIVQTFEDGGFWEFEPFNRRPEEGKLRRSVDRHGNEMRFEYDAMGRLARVIDTLDRPITIAYDADGFIESVTDFIGRRVRYTYYQAGETGGSRGDLKTATGPAVTGTPNGNDFPDGKTWTYTYSTGFEDDALNHNLLTITDPKGQRYLTNIYGTTGVPREPADVVYDRVLRQIWGNPTDTIDFVYGALPAEPANNNAVVKTIVRDRVGNVKEYLYDERNRVVILREYTGRADPSKPTTERDNRPVNKLRASDPAFFETRYEYNNDSLKTRETHPNGNVTEYVYEGDLDRGAPPRKRADLRVMRRLPGSHTPVGDQTSIEERYEYDPRFGGMEFVTKHTDARGNMTMHQYDSDGDRMHTQHRIPAIVEDFEYNEFGQLTAHVLPDNGSGYRRRDQYTYHTTGPQRGYPQSEIVDSATLRLTTAFETDAVGNVIRLTDPRGHDTQHVVNQRDQLVRTIAREVSDGSGIRHQRDISYDANDNVVRIDVQNVDENGALETNTHLSTALEFEILDHPTRITREVDASRSIVTETQYDANRNPIRLRSGEAVNGTEPANVTQLLHDERDLVLRSVRAPGHADQSSTEIDYDRNGNTVGMRLGVEDNPRLWTTIYDGYDRAVSVRDPMGNVSERRYDPNGNIVGTRTNGERTDALGAGGNVRLAEATNVLDPMDRVSEIRVAFFDTVTQAAIGDGQSTARFSYSDMSQLLRAENDNAHATTLGYDTANRASVVTDAKGNTLTYGYDANSNLRSLTEVEKSDLGSADETFVTQYGYDNLDRLVELIDNVANTTRFQYDSRDNLTRQVDPKGNVTRYAYDGVDRLIETIYALTTTGDGTGTPAGTIQTQQRFDDNFRLTAEIDDNGNTTTYGYDPLNRVVSVTMADGTAHTVAYDVHDNAVSGRNANGTTVTSTYDLLERLTRNDFTPGSGVAADTRVQTLAYDGLSRLVRAEDDDSTVTRQYDSLSQMTRETLHGAASTWMRDGVGNAVAMTYPGGRRLTSTFDELERIRAITDASTGLVARYDYIGSGRIERREYGNGTRTAFDFDAVKRVVRTTHSRGATVFDDRSYSWDPMYRKTGRTDVLSNLVETFRFDSIYRMFESRRTPPAGPAQTVTYAFDGVHDRISVTGGPDAGAYTRDATAPAPADRQTNQYTATPFDTRHYDENGNLTQVSPSAAPQQTLSYDVQDRMATFTGGATARYRYDALGRRIEKTVGSHTTRFFFAGAQEIEEQDGGGDTLATYVYGNYVDEPLTLDRGAGQLFYHADQLFNVTALTNQAGSVVESYAYGDFGLPTFAAGSGAPLDASEVGNPFLFTGRRYDEESGLYYYRSRYLDPRAGRFTTRDTIGSWGDPANLGNAYAYGGNDPVTMMDPFGQLATGSADYNSCMANCAKRRGVEFATFGLVSTRSDTDLPPSQLFEIEFADGRTILVHAENMPHDADLQLLNRATSTEATGISAYGAQSPVTFGPNAGGSERFVVLPMPGVPPGGPNPVGRERYNATSQAGNFGLGTIAASRVGSALLGLGARGFESTATGHTSQAIFQLWMASGRGGFRKGTQMALASAPQYAMAAHKAGVAFRGAETAAGRAALMRGGAALLRRAGPVVAAGMFALDLKNCHDCCAKAKCPPGDC